jgi:hypothetical protein
MGASYFARFLFCAGLAESLERFLALRFKGQLDTNRMERSEFSRTAAATFPKNSVSPAGLPTPMTIRLY